MMDWTPIVFVTFKALVLGTGMFFAIKWHYDQGKKDKDKAKQNRALLSASGKVVALFALLLLALGIVTFFAVRMAGLEMTFL
ncbi:hypothetical protein BA896_000995 [Janthinobacterium lividum]|uniref:Uncharacterized protein n=1 Tax=Janthinobacterium lividum TaxID=29581 RepID=A0A1E8PNA4_9BURK|nr:hypothetical protein BA896_000995 [Janthinobacterium lividum]